MLLSFTDGLPSPQAPSVAGVTVLGLERRSWAWRRGLRSWLTEAESRLRGSLVAGGSRGQAPPRPFLSCLAPQL